jgi:hypothetical protein
VARCAACAAELALLRDAGAVLRADAPAVDEAAIASAVRGALREARAAGAGARHAAVPEALTVTRGDGPGNGATRGTARPRRARPAWGLRAAAAALLAVGVGAAVVGREAARVASAPPASAPARPAPAVPSPASPVTIAPGAPAPAAGGRRAERVAAGGPGPAPLLGDTFADLSDAEVRLIVAAVDGEVGPALDPDDAAVVNPGGL